MSDAKEDFSDFPKPEDYEEERIKELLSTEWGKWATPQGYWINVAEMLLEKLEALRSEHRKDLRCSICKHPPESHHAGQGQCYRCPASNRCVGYKNPAKDQKSPI